CGYVPCPTPSVPVPPSQPNGHAGFLTAYPYRYPSQAVPSPGDPSRQCEREGKMMNDEWNQESGRWQVHPVRARAEEYSARAGGNRDNGDFAVSQLSYN